MRYITAQQLKEFLTSYSIPQVFTDDILEVYIQQAEDYVDSYTNRVFNLRKYNELMNGTGNWTLILKHNPVLVLEKIVVRYYPLAVVRTFTETDGYIILDRKIGKVAIRPSFALLSAFPPDYAQYYAYIFPRGESNINVEYYTAHFFVGDNKPFDEIGNKGYFDIMTKGETETTIYFDLPFAIGTYNWKMYKGGSTKDLIDDTQNWQLISSTRIEIEKQNFDSNAWYRLVYIPSQVAQATKFIASAMLLNLLGGSDNKQLGGAGTQSISVSGFSESYGEFGKYSGQIKKFYEQAHTLLAKFKRGIQASLGR